MFFLHFTRAGFFKICCCPTRSFLPPSQNLVINFREWGETQAPISIKVEMVKSFKFRGISITSNLAWINFVEVIANKAHQHYFLMNLRRFGMSVTIPTNHYIYSPSHHPSFPPTIDPILYFLLLPDSGTVLFHLLSGQLNYPTTT